MPDVLPELLVILEPGLAQEALTQLRLVTSVTQVLAPRLILVRADRDTMARAKRIRGVLEVYNDAPLKFPSNLTSSERLFVSAWKARRRPKTRRGEGLPWDAPGYLPPDPSTHRRR